MKNKKILFMVIFLIALLLILALVKGEEIINLVSLMSKGDSEDVINLIKASPYAPVISILLMVFQSVLAPIPSFLIAGANGVIFGIAGGVVISWIGAMCGAAVTFYLSRIFGEPFVRKFEKSNSLLKKVEEINEKHGTMIILIGRLLPFISFDFLSYAAGLSTIKPSRFFLATGIGMLPGTLLYVTLGNQIGLYETYSTYITIGVLIAIAGWILFQWRKKKKENKETEV